MAGPVFTKDNVLDYLRKYNKDYVQHEEWRNVFSNVDLSKQMNMSDVKADYGEVFGQAYKSAKQNENAIAGSDLIYGNKLSAMSENSDALNKAYEAYLSKMSTDLNAIEENALKALNPLANQYANQIATQDKAWELQAENSVKYGNAHFDYLNKLWEKYQNGELTQNIFDGAEFNSYMNSTYDADGNMILDENGNPMRQMKDINEIKNSLFDSDGNLNAKGVDFFDMLEHDNALRDYSFSDYLLENDEELYNWAVSDNIYGDATNARGQATYDAAFREMMGQISTDEGYSFIERGFGLNDGEIEQLFAGTKAAANEVYEAFKTGNQTSVDSAADKLGTNLEKLLVDLGIENDVMQAFDSEKLKGYEIDSISDLVKSVAASYTEGAPDMNPADYYGEILSMSAAGATIGSVAGLPGTVLGLALGLISSTIDASYRAVSDTLEYDKVTDANADKIRDLYNEFVASAVAYAQTKNVDNAEAFKKEETAAGGTITQYDPFISQHNGYYNYRLKDGKTLTYLSSGESDGPELGKMSGVRDKEGDNFSLKYDGKKYSLQVGKKVMDGKIEAEARDYVYKSTGRKLKAGDTFMYDGRMWVVTKGDTIRSITNGTFNTDYMKLIKAIRGTK